MAHRRLRDTDEFVAVNAALVLQSFFSAYFYLRGEAVIAGINRRADDRGKLGIDENLAAYNDEDPILFRIMSRAFINPVELAPSQRSTW